GRRERAPQAFVVLRRVGAQGGARRTVRRGRGEVAVVAGGDGDHAAIVVHRRGRGSRQQDFVRVLDRAEAFGGLLLRHRPDVRVRVGMEAAHELAMALADRLRGGVGRQTEGRERVLARGGRWLAPRWRLVVPSLLLLLLLLLPLLLTLLLRSWPRSLRAEARLLVGLAAPALEVRLAREVEQHARVRRREPEAARDRLQCFVLGSVEMVVDERDQAGPREQRRPFAGVHAARDAPREAGEVLGAEALRLPAREILGGHRIDEALQQEPAHEFALVGPRVAVGLGDGQQQQEHLARRGRADERLVRLRTPVAPQARVLTEHPR